MTELLDHTARLLESVGFKVWPDMLGEVASRGFEDSSIMGFVFELQTPAALLEKWAGLESTVIARHAVRFREAGDKAWNVYCIFLAPQPATASDVRQIKLIEENLERTRKLAAAIDPTEANIFEVLLPILPLASRPTLVEFDAEARLKRILDGISPGISNLLTAENFDASSVLAQLGGP